MSIAWRRETHSPVIIRNSILIAIVSRSHYLSLELNLLLFFSGVLARCLLSFTQKAIKYVNTQIIRNRVDIYSVTNKWRFYPIKIPCIDVPVQCAFKIGPQKVVQTTHTHRFIGPSHHRRRTRKMQCCVTITEQKKITRKFHQIFCDSIGFWTKNVKDDNNHKLWSTTKTWAQNPTKSRPKQQQKKQLIVPKDH